VREWVAKALFNKGVALGQLNRSAEAIKAYEEVVERFGAATEAPLQEVVAAARLELESRAHPEDPPRT
jgi:hypothetical protein